jgi:hypothetical protein
MLLGVSRTSLSGKRDEENLAWLATKQNELDPWATEGQTTGLENKTCSKKIIT